MSFHVFQASNIFLSILVYQLTMSGIVLIKRSFEISSFLEYELTLSMFLQIFIHSAFIHIFVAVLNNGLANDFVVFPECF